MARIEGLRVYGDADPGRSAQRLGVIAFNLEPYPHALVAAVLATEFGIGVRNGCFCAHPYLIRLLGLSAADVFRLRGRMAAGDRGAVPGMVRVSFGHYSTHDEVDALVDALQRIARGEIQGDYGLDRPVASIRPRAGRRRWRRHFGLAGPPGRP